MKKDKQKAKKRGRLAIATYVMFAVCIFFSLMGIVTIATNDDVTATPEYQAKMATEQNASNTNKSGGSSNNSGSSNTYNYGSSNNYGGNTHTSNSGSSNSTGNSGNIDSHITYDYDGGTGNNASTYTFSEGYTLKAPTKMGYTFTGWTGSNGTTPQLYVTIPRNTQGDKSYKANWQLTTYTITYNLNGGTNSNSNPATYTVESNTITLANPTRTDYMFGGWYTNSSLTNKKAQIAKGSTGDLTLYAKWTPTQYAITYNLNGGTNSGSNPAKYTVESGAITFANPTRAGYTFGGWYTNSACTQSTTGIAAGSHGNMTVYAKWNIITYTITYNLNGGTNSSSNPTKYTVETIGNGIALAPATKETVSNSTGYEYLGNGNYGETYYITEYSFLGWYTESTFVNKVTAITLSDGDVTLYAKWSETTTTTTMEQSYLRDGNYIYFGTYPQTEVTDSTIKTALTTQAGILPTAENAQAWTSYGYYINGSVSDYMWYIDLTYNGEKYRGVYFTSYRPNYTTNSSSAGNSSQDDNGYNTGMVYWFKYEPIKWRILSEYNGNALILCEMIIDSQEYYSSSSSGKSTHNGGWGYANNYALSNIRKWLNDTFYNTAFTASEKNIIIRTTVSNSSRYTTFACANTQDYVFLRSEQEVSTAGDYSSYDTTRRKKNTDYAKCQGAYTSTDGSYYDNGCWWLRSPSNNDSLAYVVYYYGNVDYISKVVSTGNGVVPALKIKLS